MILWTQITIRWKTKVWQVLVYPSRANVFLAPNYFSKASWLSNKHLFDSSAFSFINNEQKNEYNIAIACA